MWCKGCPCLPGPSDAGGCQDLRLGAGRIDGAWDGVMQWRLASVTNTTNSSDPTPVTIGVGHAPLVALLLNASLVGWRRLNPVLKALGLSS